MVPLVHKTYHWYAKGFNGRYHWCRGINGTVGIPKGINGIIRVQEISKVPLVYKGYCNMDVERQGFIGT